MITVGTLSNPTHALMRAAALRSSLMFTNVAGTCHSVSARCVSELLEHHGDI